MRLGFEARWESSRRVGLVVLLALVALPGLGSPDGGTHPDESTYLAVSTEMAERGAWLTPWLDGAPSFFKPPLFYWAQRLAYLALGPTLFAGRLPAALCALALALVVGRLSRRLNGPSTEASATLMCAGSLGLHKYGRLAMMDTAFTLALTAAVWATLSAIDDRAPRRLAWAGAAVGLAVMLKGPLGAVFGVPVCEGLLALRAPDLARSRFALLAGAVAALVALPWFGVALWLHGRAFAEAYFLREHLAKFEAPWALAGEASLLGLLAVVALPWPFLALGRLFAMSRWREPAVLVPLIWLAVPLAVLSIPSSKFPHSLLPCLPPVVLLAAGSPTARWARGSTAALLGVVAAALASAALLWPGPWGFLGAACAAGFTAAAALAARGQLASCAAATSLSSTLLVAAVLPAMNPPLLPPRVVSSVAGRPLSVTGSQVGLWRCATGLEVRRADGPEEVGAALESGGVVALSQSDFDALPEPVRGAARPTLSWPRVRRRLPPEALLGAWRAGDATALLEDLVLLEGAP